MAAAGGGGGEGRTAAAAPAARPPGAQGRNRRARRGTTGKGTETQPTGAQGGAVHNVETRAAAWPARKAVTKQCNGGRGQDGQGGGGRGEGVDRGSAVATSPRSAPWWRAPPRGTQDCHSSQRAVDGGRRFAT